MVVNNFLCKYFIKQLNPPCLLTQFSGNSRSELTDIDGKACNNIINLLYQPDWTVLVKLGEINMTPLIILNKTQFYYRVKF